MSAAPPPSTYPVQDNGVWLIVIVFGYIFGLFLIFVIIWFVWYGTSLKRRQTANSIPATSSNHNFSQYDYSVQSSLNKHRAYLPGTVRTNPAFNAHDDLISIHNQKVAINLNNSTTSGDEASSSHSTSFVHSSNTAHTNGINFTQRI